MVVVAPIFHSVMVVVAPIFHSQSFTFPIFYDNDGDGDDDEEFHLFIPTILCGVWCEPSPRVFLQSSLHWWRCSDRFDPNIDESDPSLQISNGQYHNIIIQWQ